MERRTRAPSASAVIFEWQAVFIRAAAVHAGVVERYFVTPVAGDDYARLTGSLREIHRALRDGTD
ncbi:hypothetical protein [Streptomyces sp. NPDC001292]|uniref:hypothetical protein n=1 Tax=Streptomyces sp. NPDC001292 TaxID=3364558 RepID=UPI0036AA486F